MICDEIPCTHAGLQEVCPKLYVTGYGGVVLTDAAVRQLWAEHPERAHWLLSLGVRDPKINGCLGDIVQRAADDCLGSLLY